VAVRAGGDRPDIGSEEAVKRAVEAARTVSFSTGPSGVYLERLFERWGILEQLRARIVVPPPGVPVGRLVASGAAQLGFQQRSELSTVPGIEILGPLPPALQSITIFSGGVAAASGQAESARALLAFMASPAVAELKWRHGLEAA
jgi:molybdate transport system substrate-binding protein